MPRSIPLLFGLLIVTIFLLAACLAPPQNLNPAKPPAADAQAAESSPTAALTPTSESPAPSPSPEPLPDYQIITLLPRDGIPAIFDPEFLTAEEAGEEYEDDELVLGVEINGEARAYSIPHLSSREIVNDTVGGRHIAATW